MSNLVAILLTVYFVGFLIAWVFAARSWIQEFGTDTETVVCGTVWGIFPATIWPLVSVGLLVRLLIKAAE